MGNPCKHFPFRYSRITLRSGTVYLDWQAASQRHPEKYVNFSDLRIMRFRRLSLNFSVEQRNEVNKRMSNCCNAKGGVWCDVWTPTDTVLAARTHLYTPIVTTEDRVVISDRDTNYRISCLCVMEDIRYARDPGRSSAWALSVVFVERCVKHKWLIHHTLTVWSLKLALLMKKANETASSSRCGLVLMSCLVRM